MNEADDRQEPCSEGFDAFEEEARMHQQPGRDRPITGAWRFEINGPASAPRGIRVKKQREANYLLLGDLWVTHLANPKRWLSYSRRPEFYSRRRSRYWPEVLTYATVNNFVEGGFRGWGWALETETSRPARRGTQSRMRLRENAADILDRGGARVIYDPPEFIILRSGDKELIDYQDTAETRRMRSHLAEINEALRTVSVGYQDNLVRTGDVICVEGQPRVVHSELYRIFNCGFGLGGRIYGGWWQNLRRNERPKILINTERTVEHDYAQLHPKLLYALAGKRLDGDAYEIEGWQRSRGKLAFNTMVNADSELAALRSIAKAIGGTGAFPKAQCLMDRLKEKHPAIARSFGSGAGLRLQRFDSDMAEGVQLRLIRRGIAALPIHDSFIVEERHEGTLQETMDDVLGETLHTISGASRDSIGYSKNVPQYGDTPSLAPVRQVAVNLSASAFCIIKQPNPNLSPESSSASNVSNRDRNDNDNAPFSDAA